MEDSNIHIYKSLSEIRSVVIINLTIFYIFNLILNIKYNYILFILSLNLKQKQNINTLIFSNFTSI